MGRRELELNPAATALEQFAHDLRELRRKAGNPSYRHLSQVAHYSASALSTAANGRALPTLPVLEAYVRACEGDEGEWRRRWHELSANSEAPASAAGRSGGFTAEPADVVGSAADGSAAPAARAVRRGRRRILIATLVVALAASAAAATSLMTASGSDMAQAGPPLQGAAVSALAPPGTACRPDVADGDLLPEPTDEEPGGVVEPPGKIDFATATNQNHLWRTWDGKVPKEAETITSDVTYQGKQTMRVVVPTGIAMIGSTSMRGLEPRDKVTISLRYDGQGAAIICPIVQEAGTFHEYFPQVRELSLTSASRQGWRTYQWTIPVITAHHIEGTAIEIVNTGAADFVFYLGAVTW